MLIFISYIALIFSIGINTLCIMLDSDNKEFYFESPNNTNTLIVEECSFLLGGWSNFYQRKYNIFKKPLSNGHDITTDDGYKPFSFNDYNIHWFNDNEFKIEYGYGSNGLVKEVIINIE